MIIGTTEEMKGRHSTSTLSYPESVIPNLLLWTTAFCVGMWHITTHRKPVYVKNKQEEVEVLYRLLINSLYMTVA